MIRVRLPHHLKTLARVDDEVNLHIEGEVTVHTVLSALEEQYPVLRGTIRDHVTLKRRAFIRFFVCNQDISLEPTDTLLPDAVVSGKEPFMVIGAMSGG